LRFGAPHVALPAGKRGHRRHPGLAPGGPPPRRRFRGSRRAAHPRPGGGGTFSVSDFELRERLTSRPDLADLDAYGAPQLDVAVRLNTNQRPHPPPTAFMEDLAGRVAKLRLYRYPGR